MWQLDFHRQELNKILDNWDMRLLQNNWMVIQRHMENWWDAYKKWESQDTFDTAFAEDRMTVRTFDEDFDKQVNKKFGSIQISKEDDRFFADSQYTTLGATQIDQHHTAFHSPDEAKHYRADRGIDSSAFAVPSNFSSREKKYEAGLHDLSASLLNHSFPIWKQVHHKWEKKANYAFLPLSQEADQEVIFKLTRYAKDRITFPQLYPMVRGYRAEMTRIKLAHDYDMGIGYTASPANNSPLECKGTRPEFKLRYGLPATTTVSAGVTQTVTQPVYLARQTAARSFKQILLTRPGMKNEIVLAMRKHAGPFPVYAVRNGNLLNCYDIVDGKMKLNGKKISMDGKLT